MERGRHIISGNINSLLERNLQCVASCKCKLSLIRAFCLINAQRSVSKVVRCSIANNTKKKGKQPQCPSRKLKHPAAHQRSKTACDWDGTQLDRCRNVHCIHLVFSYTVMGYVKNNPLRVNFTFFLKEWMPTLFIRFPSGDMELHAFL